MKREQISHWRRKKALYNMLSFVDFLFDPQLRQTIGYSKQAT